MSKKIDVNKWYSLGDLVEMRVFPWAGRNQRVYRRLILEDLESGNLLKAVVTGSDTARRYRVKGVNVIKYIALFESGKTK